MKRQAIVVLLVMALSAAVARSQITRSGADPLVSAQAADVLANLITLTSQHADARVAAMHQYLSQIGKDQAFAQTPPPPKENAIFFNELFKGAVLFIKDGGAQYADPALAKMSGQELTSEFNELQVYNVQTFLHLIEQKHAVDAMEKFLQASGNLDAYNKWAAEHGITPRQPTLTTPQEAAARMDEMIKEAKSTAWAKAEALGMSQEEFEKDWKDRVQQHRESVAKQVDGCKRLARSLEAPPKPAPAPPPLTSPGPTVPPKQGAVPPAPPPSGGQSRYTREYFETKNKELWDRFND